MLSEFRPFSVFSVTKSPLPPGTPRLKTLTPLQKSSVDQYDYRFRGTDAAFHLALADALESVQLDPSPKNFRQGLDILLYTQQTASRANLIHSEYLPIRIEQYESGWWKNGIMAQTISYKDSKGSYRVYETGFSVDPAGSVVINQVQKHTLRLGYRRSDYAVKNGLAKEKQAGDTYWRAIGKDTGYDPELFGFLLIALHYAPHTDSGRIVFPTYGNQEEIKLRNERLAPVYEACKRLNVDPHRVDGVKELETEIRMIADRTDYERMLKDMGVVSKFYRSGYQYTTLPDILNGIHNHWTDDEGHNRYPYRHVLYSVFHAQKRTIPEPVQVTKIEKRRSDMTIPALIV